MGDTSWPGLGSNTALAGHVTLRNGADGPFRYLETLKRGASLTVFTEKFIYTYQVQELKVVNDSDMSVVKPSDQSILTLITCTGWDNALGHYIKRLIVVADLVDTQPIVIRGN
jgi:sortase A